MITVILKFTDIWLGKEQNRIQSNDYMPDWEIEREVFGTGSILTAIGRSSGFRRAWMDESEYRFDEIDVHHFRLYSPSDLQEEHPLSIQEAKALPAVIARVSVIRLEGDLYDHKMCSFYTYLWDPDGVFQRLRSVKIHRAELTKEFLEQHWMKSDVVVSQYIREHIPNKSKVDFGEHTSTEPLLGINMVYPGCFTHGSVALQLYTLRDRLY